MKCKICGAPHANCGPPTTVIPVDERVALRKEGAVGDLKRYEVQIPGRHGKTTTTTLLLSDEDAERQGLTPADLAGKAAPSNKAAQPEGNKDDRPKMFGRK